MVKCADCGLLTARSRDKRELVEVGTRYRQEGFTQKYMDAMQDGLIPIHDAIPECFVLEHVLVHELPSEFFDYITPEHDLTAMKQVRSVLNNERSCNRFIEWQQGFTPKEHIQDSKARDFEKWKQSLASRTAIWTVVAGAGIGAVVAIVLQVISWVIDR